MLVLVASAFAQQPQVKVSVLNVCAPSADEQKELSSALAQIPGKPVFAADYEVDRGHSTLDPNTSIPGMQSMPSGPAGAASAANWVRVRREFPGAALFSNVQYSFSVDSQNMVETLVLRVRDPKPNDLLQVSIEDSASAVTSPAAMLSSSTPVSRVKLERFGKPSVGLARCTGAEGNPATNQSAYEPIFHAASSIMERYRAALGAPKMVPDELARMRAGNSVRNSTGTSIKTGTKPTVGDKKNK
jgi:hypothetical protein